MDKVANLALLLASDTPTLVYVKKKGCPPCGVTSKSFKQVRPQLEQHMNVVELDFEEDADVLPSLGVKSVPVLITYRTGRKVSVQTGALSPDQILSSATADSLYL